MRESERARRHARRNAYRRGRIDEGAAHSSKWSRQWTSWRRHFVTCAYCEADVPPYSYFKSKNSAHTFIKCDVCKLNFVAYPRGYWIVVCILISVRSGWLRFHGSIPKEIFSSPKASGTGLLRYSLSSVHPLGTRISMPHIFFLIYSSE